MWGVNPQIESYARIGHYKKYAVDRKKEVIQRGQIPQCLLT